MQYYDYSHISRQYSVLLCSNRAEERCSACYLAGGCAIAQKGTYSSRNLDESNCRKIRSFSIDDEFTGTRDADADPGYSAPDRRCIRCRSFEAAQTSVEAPLNARRDQNTAVGSQVNPVLT